MRSFKHHKRKLLFTCLHPCVVRSCKLHKENSSSLGFSPTYLHHCVASSCKQAISTKESVSFRVFSVQWCEVLRDIQKIIRLPAAENRFFQFCTWKRPDCGLVHSKEGGPRDNCGLYSAWPGGCDRPCKRARLQCAANCKAHASYVIHIIIILCHNNIGLRLRTPFSIPRTESRVDSCMYHTALCMLNQHSFWASYGCEGGCGSAVVRVCSDLGRWWSSQQPHKQLGRIGERWKIISTIYKWAIPVNRNTPLLRNSNCVLRGLQDLMKYWGVLKLFQWCPGGKRVHF